MASSSGFRYLAHDLGIGDIVSVGVTFSESLSSSQIRFRRQYDARFGDFSKSWQCTSDLTNARKLMPGA